MVICTSQQHWITNYCDINTFFLNERDRRVMHTYRWEVQYLKEGRIYSIWIKESMDDCRGWCMKHKLWNNKKNCRRNAYGSAFQVDWNMGEFEGLSWRCMIQVGVTYDQHYSCTMHPIQFYIAIDCCLDVEIKIIINNELLHWLIL